MPASPPAGPVMSRLVHGGVLLRRAGRLRVAGPVLADAERAAALGLPTLAALADALRRHGYGGDATEAARFLDEFLAEREQLGLLRPAFPRPTAEWVLAGGPHAI